MVSNDHHSDSEESFHSFDDESTPSGPAVPDTERDGSTRDPAPAKADPAQDDVEPSPAELERFTPEVEASLLAESNSLKGAANQLFGKGSYENAIQTYDKALSSCPNYLEYELAVLRSNIAACHLKLEEWKEAIDSATKAIDGLENLEPLPVLEKTSSAAPGADGAGDKADKDVVAEIDEREAERIEKLEKSGHTLDEVRKLQVKLLMRRAQARSRLGGWSVLQGADEDYRTLLTSVMLASISNADQRSITTSVQQLAPRLTRARDAEVAEMMDKLKGLGNSILKPFGLSTNNFQFVKDEKSGGYSMNFSQGGNK